MKAMRTALYGGSFDPPHRAHLAVAQAAADAFELDRVLLAPTGRQPLKSKAPQASFDDRLAMTRLLCIEDPRLEATDLDAPHPDGTPNYTIDLLRSLHTSENRLFVIVGADSFSELHRWKEPEALLQIAEWIVVSRPGAPSPQPTERIHLLDTLSLAVSATRIREQSHTIQTATQIVDLTPEVAAYIDQHHLYRE
jgi:nicotinate-nucleotide adenylyltransferase